MLRCSLILLALAAACGAISVARPDLSDRHAIGFAEHFEGTDLLPDWLATTPGAAGAHVRLEQGKLILAMPAGGTADVIVRRRFDASPLRGQRVRLSVRSRTDGAAASFSRATISATIGSGLLFFGDSASTRAVSSGVWTQAETVIDIPGGAVQGELSLALHGPGLAWFDDVEVTPLGAAPPFTAARLSSQQLAGLLAFTRAAAVIRYLHPSDQAAALDWNEFYPAAVEQVLATRSPPELLAALRNLFSPAAPMATFSMTSDPRSLERTMPPHAQHLVRWRRYGHGDSTPFWAFREGRDPEAGSAEVSTRIRIEPSRGCSSVSFKATGRKLPGPGQASLFATMLGAVTKADERSQAFSEDGAAVITAKLPERTQEIELGVRIDGRLGIEVDKIAMACDGRWRSVEFGSDAWTYFGPSDLYSWQIASCGSGNCVRLQRNPLDVTFVPARDQRDLDLGSGIVLHLPMAVWTDGAQTLPKPSSGDPPAQAHFTLNDLALRISTVSAAWGTLSVFYPYFEDQHLDWPAALPDALVEAAGAGSPFDVYGALSHLVAKLQDNHVKVSHPGMSTAGALPLVFRKFGDQVVVTGGLRQYMTSIAIGSELVELDGVPALGAYERAAAQVSAATEGLRTYLAPIRMGMGATGSFHRLRIRDRSGRLALHVLPLVQRDAHFHDLREPRPETGSELTPGIYYVDLDFLADDAWARVIPRLEGARAIIFDLRGYPVSTGLDALSHLSTRVLHSPIWQVPQITSTDGVKYMSSSWDVRPQQPTFTAKIIGLVDGRSMSSMETSIQILRDAGLAVLVGETTGGTNGNSS